MEQVSDTENYVDHRDENYIDIDNLTGVQRKATRLRIAKKVADENLGYINAHDIPAYPRNTFYSNYGKRALDIFVSAIALIALFPINVVLGICTFFDVGRPIFFRQTRIGRNGKPFTIVKFRNMNNETDTNGDLLLAEYRVTRFGKFVRKTSLDELLNFWNIFKGDMSIIGPRPLPEEYLERYSERHKARLAVRPGLECPLIHRLNHVASWGEKFDNDVYYVENISFMLDIKMVFLLVKMVFDPKLRALREDGSCGSFMGYKKSGESINSRAVPEQYVKYVY